MIRSGACDCNSALAWLFSQGPESIATFVAGCRGEPYFEGASASVGQAVVQLLEAMYKSVHSGKAEDINLS
eukprot:COSAG02_NODE_16692_length_1063_cov_1.285270_1_plen_71_part_00